MTVNHSKEESRQKFLFLLELHPSLYPCRCCANLKWPSICGLYRDAACHGLCQWLPHLMQLWTQPNVAFAIGPLSSSRIGGVSVLSALGWSQDMMYQGKKACLSLLPVSALLFAAAINGSLPCHAPAWNQLSMD